MEGRAQSRARAPRDILIWRRRPAARWPSAAILGACLALAMFFQPYWIAAAAAATAAGTEYYSPRIPMARDDNLSVVVALLAVMAGLTIAARRRFRQIHRNPCWPLPDIMYNTWSLKETNIRRGDRGSR